MYSTFEGRKVTHIISAKSQDHLMDSQLYFLIRNLPVVPSVFDEKKGDFWHFLARRYCLRCIFGWKRTFLLPTFFHVYYVCVCLLESQHCSTLKECGAKGHERTNFANHPSASFFLLRYSSFALLLSLCNFQFLEFSNLWFWCNRRTKISSKPKMVLYLFRRTWGIRDD